MDRKIIPFPNGNYPRMTKEQRAAKNAWLIPDKVTCTGKTTVSTWVTTSVEKSKAPETEIAPDSSSGDWHS